MKAFLSLSLFAVCQLCFAQTDTKLIAAGNWSEAVPDGDHSLRGRLLVYDEPNPPCIARIYIELQHISTRLGARTSPIEIYFYTHDDLRFEMRHGSGQLVPPNGTGVASVPSPRWIVFPCDSSESLRVNDYFRLNLLMSAPSSDPAIIESALKILVCSGCWLIAPDATNDFFLSASFTPQTNHPSPLNYPIWQGTLKLPAVKIPAKWP